MAAEKTLTNDLRLPTREELAEGMRQRVADLEAENRRFRQALYQIAQRGDHCSEIADKALTALDKSHV